MSMVSCTVWIPEEAGARVDALVPKMASHPRWRAVRVTRSVVIRECLYQGLDNMEQEYGAPGKGELKRPANGHKG